MYSNSQKIISAFSLGYFSSLVNGFFNSPDAKEISREINSFIIERSYLLMKTFNPDFKNLFNEDIPVKGELRTQEEYENYFMGFFSNIKEKFHFEHQGIIEIAFLVGSLVSMADSKTAMEIDLDKFSVIIYELLSELKITISWLEVNRLVTQIRCKDKDMNKVAREEIWAMINGTEKIGKSRMLLEIEELILEVAA
jgi:hypothetical protein